MVDNNFNFGYIGDFTEFNFTSISNGTSGDFEFGTSVYIFKILMGTNNNFNSVWADPKASLTSGKFYIGRSEDLTIVNNRNGQVSIEDYYSTTTEGSTEESLTSDDLVDINVSY